MNFVDNFMEKWNALVHRVGPLFARAKEIWKTVSDKVSFVFRYILKFKKLFLCVPVAVFAIILAIRNLFSLPALVGLALSANGDFAFEMLREIAVLGPMVVTGLCLLLVFLSKRTLTPWLVSVFSLVLPIWILFINTFPS